jgi:hypothetical protein
MGSQARTVGDFLQTVPGLQVGDPSSASSVMMSRSQAMVTATKMTGAQSCELAWFMDGHRMDRPGESDSMAERLTSISLDNVAGIEIFRGLSEIPAEFADPDVRCGAIALWTRVG